MKLNKKKKAVRMRGSRLHGWAAKKHKGSGNRGGMGMAGTGKRADQKKSFILRYYGKEYYGRAGMSRKTRALEVINLEFIQKNLNSFVKKYSNSKKELDLSKYKILGKGDLKEKLTIKCLAVSKSAKEKIEKIGGKVITKEVKEEIKKD